MADWGVTISPTRGTEIPVEVPPEIKDTFDDRKMWARLNFDQIAEEAACDPYDSIICITRNGQTVDIINREITRRPFARPA